MADAEAGKHGSPAPSTSRYLTRVSLFPEPDTGQEHSKCFQLKFLCMWGAVLYSQIDCRESSILFSTQCWFSCRRLSGKDEDFCKLAVYEQDSKRGTDSFR